MFKIAQTALAEHGIKPPMGWSVYRQRADACADEAKQAWRPHDRNRHLREAALWHVIADRFDAYQQSERVWAEAVRLGNLPSLPAS